MIDLLHGNSHELLKTIPSNSIDLVLTDPPYKYLDHRLDADFDEQSIFSELFRVMKDDSMLLKYKLSN